jgi:hypothetical protein
MYPPKPHFETLDKRGNSDFLKRASLLQRFCELSEQKKANFYLFKKQFYWRNVFMMTLVSCFSLLFKFFLIFIKLSHSVLGVDIFLIVQIFASSLRGD